MINTILRTAFKLIFFIIRWIFNLLLLPLKPIISIFPTYSEFLEDAINFFDDYIITAISFAREVFLNLTGFPQEIITISVNASLAFLTYIVTLRLITFIKNVYRMFKGGGE